jgi:hypothetical protein
MKLDAVWQPSSKVANVLGAYVDKGNTFTSLEAMDAKATSQTTYVNNPFMYLSFDGLTGAGSARTFGVGQTSTLVNNSTALNLNGKIAVSTAGGANITTYIDKSSPTTWANSIAQFTQKMQQPALFGLQQSGTNWNFDFAPNRPAPVQVNLFSSRTPAYQYIVADAELARTTGLYQYDPAIVTWLNCSEATKSFFTANTVSSGKSLSCNPTRAGDFVLNGNAVGTDVRFLGLALLPPGKIPLFMYPICADETVDVRNAKGQKGTLSIDNPGTQLSQLELTSTLEAPESLAQMIELINKETACATIDKEKFNIIWNLGSQQVVPSALACQSGGSGPAPVVPQGTAGPSPNATTPAPGSATAPAS